MTGDRLPRRLLLVRHGESVENAAKDGGVGARRDLSTMSSLEYELTPWGEEQARIAGGWIKANVGELFDRYYVSPYRRARHTAGLLALPDAKWKVDLFLGERFAGLCAGLTRGEVEVRFPDIAALAKRDPLYTPDVSGESYVDVAMRVQARLATFAREASDGCVVVVAHAGVLRMFRILLERYNAALQQEFMNHPDPRTSIHNCQILEYRREDPTTGRAYRTYTWTRSVCPWDESRSTNEWERIERPLLTNEELLEF